MPNLHAQWVELCDQLRDVENRFFDAIGLVVAWEGAGGKPTGPQLAAVDEARVLLDRKRREVDAFVAKHVTGCS